MSNLLTNPGFATNLSGWFEEESGNLNSFWSSLDADGSPSSGSLVGVALTHPPAGDIAWQCVDVVPGEDYLLAFRGREERHSNHDVNSAMIRLIDMSGHACPGHGDQPGDIGTTIQSLSINPVQANRWDTNFDFLVMPAGVTRVAVAARVCCADPISGGTDDDFGAHFDNVVFGELAADLSLEASVSKQSVAPNEQLTFELTVSNAGTVLAEDPEVRIYHGGHFELDYWLCGNGTLQDNGTYLSWLDLPGLFPSASASCSITVRALPGHAGALPVDVVADCSDCDLTPADNQQHFDLELLARPEISPQLDVAPFPEVGDDAVFSLSLVNSGTADGISSVTLTTTRALDFQPTDTGNCANFLQTDIHEISGHMLVSAGGSTDCEFHFQVPEGTSGGALQGVVSTVTTGDYVAGNNDDSAGTQLIDLVVNRIYDGVDRTPGNGICELNAGQGDCTLRSAVMEANALGAATGHVYTVRVPHSSFAYTVSRTPPGDDASQYGSIDITRRMRIVGVPNATGLRPLILASFPDGQQDRLFRIGGSAGFVRMENLHLRGQNATPANLDGAGVDGGLILHRSGALELFNVSLADGATSGSGGAIFSRSDDAFGDLELERVKVFDNLASGSGGGIAFVPESFAVLSLIESEVHGNEAGSAGGAVHVLKVDGNALPSALFDRSALHGNVASAGAGGYFEGVFLARFDNSTVSGNLADLQGGGLSLLSETAVAVNNSTIAHNEAGPGSQTVGDGGGMYVSGDSTVTLYNSIVSNNVGRRSCSQPNPSLPPICLPVSSNCHGSVGSAGYNAMAGDAECAFSDEPTDDRTHVQLAALADNGGPTPTHAPASLTWIVDAGDPACLNQPGGDPLGIDQRGAFRPADGDGDGVGQCDRGAHEVSDSARISVVVDGVQFGRVQSSPAGIACGADTPDSCSAMFAFETEVTLTATAAPGGEFVEWQGACSGQGNPCSLTALGDGETTAVFTSSGPVVDALFSDRFESP